MESLTGWPESDNDSRFPSTVYKITKEAMSVSLGFLEATVRRAVTSAGTASCERPASRKCVTAWRLQAAGDQGASPISVFPFSFLLSSLSLTHSPSLPFSFPPSVPYFSPFFLTTRQGGPRARKQSLLGTDPMLCLETCNLPTEEARLAWPG